jgi:L-lactate dehydrogenase (cytochrome)
MPSRPAPVNLEDVRRHARRRLPRAIFDFIDGGAGSDVTVRANRAAFGRYVFQPRPLVDVAHRDQTVTVFGKELSLPVILGPAGTSRLVHHSGELAIARAAAQAKTAYVLGAASSYPLEEVADAGRGASMWFQLYVWRDPDIVKDLVRRAAAAKFDVLCVTIDTPITGLKDRDLRNGLSIPPRITVRNALDTARHLRWFASYLRHDSITFKNLDPYGFDMGGSVMGLSAFMRSRLNNPSNTWDDLKRVRSQWDGPLVVKGVLTAEAATKAFEAGADGIICSNHGGRNLECNPATIDALPAVTDVAAAKGKEVFLDGGVRRGTDVVKALAIGATACLIARPYHWGLATKGESGVVEVLEILRREIDNVLALVGRPRLDDLDRSVVASAITTFEHLDVM